MPLAPLKVSITIETVIFQTKRCIDFRALTPVLVPAWVASMIGSYLRPGFRFRKTNWLNFSWKKNNIEGPHLEITAIKQMKFPLMYKVQWFEAKNRWFHIVFWCNHTIYSTTNCCCLSLNAMVKAQSTMRPPAQVVSLKSSLAFFGMA